MCNYAIFDCLWHKYITRVLCFGGFQSWQNSLELRQPLRQLPKKQAMASADPGHLPQHCGQSWPRDTPAGAPVWLRGFSTKDTHGQLHGRTHAFQRGTVMSLLSTGGVGTVQLCPSVPLGCLFLILPQPHLQQRGLCHSWDHLGVVFPFFQPGWHPCQRAGIWS